jgi:hypothetical protein
MAISNVQLQQLKADMAADPVFGSMPKTVASATTIAAVYNQTASPDWWVWRTSVSQSEIVGAPSPDATSWSWTAYIGRSQGERDAWREMFADAGAINPSLDNVRQGLADIFSGTTGTAQRAHLLAIGRRKASRVEKLLSTGTGSTASPAKLGWEGALIFSDVMDAWNAS